MTSWLRTVREIMDDEIDWSVPGGMLELPPVPLFINPMPFPVTFVTGLASADSVMTKWLSPTFRTKKVRIPAGRKKSKISRLSRHRGEGFPANTFPSWERMEVRRQLR